MARKALKLGLLIPQEGPAGIWSPSCEASALLAVAELNTGGGMLGREVDLVVANTGCTSWSAAEAVSSMIDLDRVEGVVALVTSAARQAVIDAVDGRVPLIYTPQFEGDEHNPGVVAIGETAIELLKPSTSWLMEEKRASRFFLVGNDYLWPQRSMPRARRLIANAGGSVVGEAMVPFGVIDHERLLKQIARARPDVVAMWLLGHEAVIFNRAFVDHGLDRKILRFSTAIEETILLGIGAHCTENLYVASGYFSNIRSRNNDAFLDRYHHYFGISPPPANSFGESIYEGFHCLSGLSEAAGSLHSKDLRDKVGRAAQSHTARGVERQFLAGTQHPVHIAAADGHEFRLIAMR
ncbi:substrate-binding domain-containing protein [Mesorhizobium argentiipisi]|uniref:Substrate-binding domain-containing protein n=1 Tax=Mesorhizobium argentiipisi TaxID=3015175 RepID=A0ABU8KMU5_9HYPH